MATPNHRKIQSLELLQKAEKMSICLIVMPITQLYLNQSILDFFRQQLCPLATICKVNTCKYSCTQEHKRHRCKLKQPITITDIWPTDSAIN